MSACLHEELCQDVLPLSLYPALPEAPGMGISIEPSIVEFSDSSHLNLLQVLFYEHLTERGFIHFFWSLKRGPVGKCVPYCFHCLIS